jgi:hypothetical protein
MSLSGTTNTYLPPTLDGLTIIDADAIYINGIPIDTENLVPYTNATKNINLGTFNFQTLGSVTAKQHVFPSFGSTLMTGPTTSSIFYADSWSMNNTLAISSLGGGSFLSTSYLRFSDGSNNSTLLTLQSDGIIDVVNNKIRISTMASNVYDVVNLSTLQASNAFIENVNALNYVPYVGSLNDLEMGASTIKTTGYVSTAYLTLSEATNSEAWTLYTLSTMGNLSTLGGLVIQETTSGNSVYLTGGVVGAKNFQFSSPGGVNAGKVVCTNGYSVMSTTISAGQLEYINGLHSNAGGVGETNTWSNTQTFSVAPTLNGLTTTTPSFSLGIDGSNTVIKFTPPTATNLLPLNNTWTGTNTFNNTVTVNGTLSATYIGATTAYSATDDRTISPSEILANTARFYFASYPNNGGTEYADAIGFNSYYDHTGGNENLLMLRKNSIGMRIFQGAFGSTSPFTTYKDVVFSENNGDVIMNGTLAVGNRFLGTVDGSNNFWVGLRGSGSEGDRLAIAIAGDATTGAVSGITLRKPTTASENLTVGVSKRLILDGTGATEIYNGQIDAYNPTGNNNLMIRSWWGIGFPSYDNIVRIGMDTRSGNAQFAGGLIAGETSLIGFTTPPLTYPFTGNKDLWVNGSIYSAGTNAMVATFGRNTTAAPYNDITFVSNSAGTLSAQIKSHTTGSSSFVDATWTYSNTNPNPLGSNQGQVLLQADKMTMSLTSGFIVGGLANIHGGSPSAVPSGFMATGSLTLGDVNKNYGGGTSWNSNTAGLMFECLDTQEIMVHDAGQRVVSLMYYNANTITMGRDAGWGISAVSVAGTLTSGSITARAGSSIAKIGGNGGQNFCLLTGDDAGSSPYLTFYQGNLRRMFVGNATGTEAQISAENGAKLTFNTEGVKNLEIDTTGNLTMTHQKSLYLYNFGVSNNAGFKSEASGDLSIFTGTAGVATRMTIDRTGKVAIGTAPTTYQLEVLGTLKFGASATPVYVGTAGSIYWQNPNGANTHFGYPSGGGSDNYIRGTQTYLDTPIQMQYGCNVSGGEITCAGQPFCIIGDATGGASIGYGAGQVFGGLTRLTAYTSVGMTNSGTNGWNDFQGRFYFPKLGKWQMNWSFYWNNFAAGSRAAVFHFNSVGTLIETRYCALNGGGIGADTTQSYSSLFYGDAGDWLETSFQSGSGTLYFGGINHTHLTFYFQS